MNDNGSFRFHSFEENSVGEDCGSGSNDGCLKLIATVVVGFLTLLFLGKIVDWFG